VPIRIPRKLIEVALPLDDINTAAAREKSIRHGHPSTLHLWWARRPLAAARAVLFAQLVNDPGGQRGWGAYPGQTKEQAARERERLFDIIRQLVLWENTTNETVLAQARHEIMRSWRETCEMNKGLPGFNPEQLPAFHDPFAGGGAIPLEAQRLGLESYASDLNPVAVLLNKAMIEIPPRFAGLPPVGPAPKDKGKTKKITGHGFGEDADAWTGARGLAEDVRRYGHWMREEAKKRIGHLYPDVELPQQHGGGRATVIAWLWARTVASPNPAFRHVAVPLVSSFYLSTKPGKIAWVEPVVEGDTYRFEVRTGQPADAEDIGSGTKLGRGSNFRCVLSGTPIDSNYIKQEGLNGRIGVRLLAVVTESGGKRIYISPTTDIEHITEKVVPKWVPETEIPNDPRNFWTLNYGLNTFGDLFTPRQLVALNTFADLVQEAHSKVEKDAQAAGRDAESTTLEDGGSGARAYADAVCVYLGMAVSKLSDAQSTLVRWKPTMDQAIGTFGRQALPMVWDFAETNVFAGMAGDYMTSLKNMMRVLDNLKKPQHAGSAVQQDAQNQTISIGKIVSTDPPYYDNIGYADLSDYFYVWLRRCLRPQYPQLFSTIAVPKAEELVATPYRHGGVAKAEKFFLNGMTEAMHSLAEKAHPAFPVTIYYAFKQSDTSKDGTVSTGWETFIDAVIQAGFSISGTWPMRTEMGNRMIGSGTNALASSIVLVCHKREVAAEQISRRDLLRELRETLPLALDMMTGGRGAEHSPVAPVDLQQAAIGPAMAVFSKYDAVLEPSGEKMSIRTALTLINRELDAFFFRAEGDLDHASRFCLTWFEQHGWSEGPFGEADVLARAKGTSVETVQLTGGLATGGGRVRLLRINEYPQDWQPAQDTRISAWEALHQLIQALRTGGERAASRLLHAVPTLAEAVRQLAYRLYTHCERASRSEDARAYNELITAWPALQETVQEMPPLKPQLEIGF
jgi:putative DNA methylase